MQAAIEAGSYVIPGTGSVNAGGATLTNDACMSDVAISITTSDPPPVNAASYACRLKSIITSLTRKTD